MSSVELVVKLRDALQMAADACQEYLERIAPNDDKWNWNPDNIKWEKAVGSSGPYERSQNKENVDFQKMVEDLKAHNGKLSRDGYFYWLFTNGDCVGRKKRK